LKEEDIFEGQVHSHSNSNNSCKCSKILVVDDEAFNIVVMEGLLNEVGIYKVDRAYNGREALSKIE
jgi:PleD family two-component response regulator